MDKPFLAWHFTDDRLRDGQPIPLPGVVLRVEPPLAMCSRDLHGSVRVIDALSYAPGGQVHRVRLSGDRIMDTDKFCAAERTILWSLPKDVSEQLLHEFGCWCAEQALALTSDPDPRSVAAIARKRQWLRGGANEEELYAARAAASAARDAASAAAHAAARAAASVAARAAARAAQNAYLTNLLNTAASSCGYEL